MNREKEVSALETKARQTIERYSMMKGKKAVVVGVSGGADSMALLSFLCSLREEFGITVTAAHVNHGLRGDEADRDEQFVRSWCEKNDVEFVVLHADVAAKAKAEGKTVEEAGRSVRYDFFEKKACERGAVIATAHTLSDSIETQIMNLARGTGLRGLCGIPPVRGNIIRPLIRCTRADTEEYCRKNGVKYVDDSTNFSHDYTRNRVRLDLVPQLYRLNPAFDKAAARLIDSLEEDARCLEEAARNRLAKAARGNGVYDLAVLLRDCPKAILSRCVSAAALDFTGRAQEAKHIDTMVDIALCGKGKTEIIGGCYVEAKDGKLIFSKSTERTAEIGDFSFPFKVGIYKNGKFRLVISPISEEDIKNYKKFNNHYFKNAVDCDKICGNALVRARMQGDKISPAGRNVTKTLKKLFNEEKIPVEKRAFVPVACDEAGVIWVGGIGVAERCKVTENTKNAVCLEIEDLEVNHFAE